MKKTVGKKSRDTVRLKYVLQYNMFGKCSLERKEHERGKLKISIDVNCLRVFLNNRR